MILVDTSIWVDHLRSSDATLAGLLNRGKVLTHPFVIGEIALGHLRQRNRILDELQSLPAAIVTSDQEVLHFIGAQGLSGLGIGYVDVHLLAAVQVTVASSLWTRDRRLHEIADRLGLAANLLDSTNGFGP